jgi:putative proteasome-type protease
LPGGSGARIGPGAAMTYCCGILVRDGLVMIADTRTNAGLDNVSTFRKLHIFERPGERVMMLATAGNLSVTQGAVDLLIEGLENPETHEFETLMKAPGMLQAAQLVGRAVRRSHAIAGEGGEQSGVSFDVSLLFGGQIEGGALRLFMIYTAGNFIECAPDTPYLQIGEHKYGKPILDRAVSYDTEVADALKIGLISMDSTIRSNLSVGLPIDIAVLRRDALRAEVSTRIDGSDPYFRDLRESWSRALRAAHIAIPAPPYGGRSG